MATLISSFDNSVRCPISANAIKMSQTLCDVMSDIAGFTGIEAGGSKEFEIKVHPEFLHRIVKYCEYHCRPRKEMTLTPEFSISYEPDEEKCPDPNCDRPKCNYIQDAFLQGLINEDSTESNLKDHCPFEECHEEFRLRSIIAWDAEFMKDFTEMADTDKKRDVLLAFMKDATYVNIKPLVELIAKPLAKMVEAKLDAIVNDKSVAIAKRVDDAKKFLREYFNVENDWAPEEEKEITDKYLWVFDVDE